MFDSKNRKSGCEFGSLVVDYVYGELAEDGLAVFDAHLGSCQECSSEIEALNSVSAAVAEWKATEFDHLPNPGIEISNGEIYPDSEVGDDSLVDRIRGMFAGYSLAFQTATALAAIAVLAGVAWVYFASGTSGQRLAEDSKQDEVAPEQAGQEIEAQKEPELVVGKEPGESGVDTVEAPVEEVKPLRVSTPPSRTKPSSKRRVRKPAAPPLEEKNKSQTPELPEPELTPIDRLSTLAASDDSEDEGLRLIELFEDTGSDR